MIRIINLASVAVTLVISAALIGLSGCAKPAAQPKIDTQDIPGYQQLNKEIGPRDFSPLVGRVIVLDPGHGGYFKGAIGPEGLTEAEVNLGVALYLRGLLEWAGATVHLTRSADYDFLSPADSTLSSDLAFRVDFSNKLQPDVFISIHHNSTASADPVINETQTYYPIGQEGASLDLARSIHRHLVMNLDIKPAKILPGNFHVLRKATVPAVLGEPAMISNPVIEGRLTLAASHNLEAKAYFLGLLDYFSGGMPRWSGSPVDTLIVNSESPAPSLSWTFLPGEGSGAPGPDISTFSLTRDGQEEAFHLSPDGFTVTWYPKSNWHLQKSTLSVYGKNSRGRATPLRETIIQPETPADLQVGIIRETGSEAGYDLLHWQDLNPGETEQGWALLPSPAGIAEEQVLQYLTTTLGAHWSGARCQTTNLTDGLQWRLLSTDGTDPTAVTQVPPGGWINRMAPPADSRQVPEGILGSDSPAFLLETGQPVWLQSRGILPLVDPAPTMPARERTVSSPDRFWIGEKLIPALFGATIVLDPAGGGTNADGTGPLGTRGADINLKTALAARRLLEGAGATVFLTRSGEYAPPNQDKARLVDNVSADLFLTIGRASRPGQLTVTHHPGSTRGIIWAQAQAQAGARLAPADSVLQASVAESWAYLLRHTACPATEVFFPPLSSVDRELQADSAAWSQAEARSILQACAVAMGQSGLLDEENGSLLDRNIIHPDQVWDSLPSGQRLAGMDWALLDGNFPWLPAETCSAVNDSISSDYSNNTMAPGLPALLPRHTLEIHQGRNWQLWLLDYSSGDLEFDLLMEGP